MKFKWIRPVALLVIFIGALVTFSIVTNKTNEDMTTTMAESTLPVLYFYDGETQINHLYGYVQKMDAASMRDSILPVKNDRLLSIGMSTYGYAVDSLSYEVRSIDGERLVANGNIEDYSNDGQNLRAQITLQNILQENEEYILIFTLNEEKKPIYYYSRVMQTMDSYTDECLAFAMEFHNKTFEPDSSDYFLNYIEANTGDSTTLSYVDLNCSLKQIQWADFKGEPSLNPNVSFKEINDAYNVIMIKYILTSVSEKGENEYYNIEEYFRLKKTPDNMYVLNYERTMNQIFRGENDFIYGNNGIQLGIRDTDVEYCASETGETVAFVQEGELWSYDKNQNELSQVYSFRGLEGIDERENNSDHDIKIVRIDEAGSVDFIVYGYMNRGKHEGEVGVGIYHYDGLAHTIEEEAFIESTSSYQILQAEMGQLMYENETSQIYLMMDGTVYAIDLNSLEVKSVISELKDESYAISDLNQYVAWVNSEELYTSDVIHMMDLKTGSSFDIKEDGDTYLRPLGFIDEDFIYGVANTSDVTRDAAGNTFFPMKALKIMDTSEGSDSILKEYQPSSGSIGSIEVEDYTIHINLISNGSGQYLASGNDAIMNRAADREKIVDTSTTFTEGREREVQISLKSSKKDTKTSKVKLITPKDIILDKTPVVDLKFEQNKNNYYVYAKGRVTKATDSISDAISRASKDMGVVIGTKEQYVWMRARKSYQDPFGQLQPSESDKEAGSIAQCISAMLVREEAGVSVTELMSQGYTPKEILENGLKDVMVLDLTGCSSDDIIYYVSRQNPVFAMTGSDSAVLITGYTANLIFYYDPTTKQTSSMPTENAKAWFEGAGNIFFSYVDK